MARLLCETIIALPTSGGTLINNALLQAPAYEPPAKGPTLINDALLQAPAYEPPAKDMSPLHA